MAESERGAAMVLAILVMVILTLLGTLFLLMADLENRIAENEVFSAQALYFAECSARAVVQWFDRPGAPDNVWPLDVSVADRTLRDIDEDGDGPGAEHHQDGGTWPRYKQGIDADGDGFDDLFDRPYRMDRANTLLGTEAHPDVRIDADASSAARTFLDGMSEALLAGYPNAAAGVHARIKSIDVFGPPYLNVAGQWVRYGLGTVRVVARIERRGYGTPQVLAERHVKLVLNEIPYSIPFAPLHSCGGLRVEHGMPAAWGAVAESLGATIDSDHTRIPASLAREAPPFVRLDLLLGSNNAPGPGDVLFAQYRTALYAGPSLIEDPWLRVIAGSALADAPNNNPQPRPFIWTPGAPLGVNTQPNHVGVPEGDHSNQFQLMPLVECPSFDYEVWRSIATSGRDGVEYYTWASGDQFRRDGTGTARSFRAITDVNPASPASRAALFFFDTADRRAPHDDDGDGRPDNLTPSPIEVDGGTWSPRGFIFLNAVSFRASNVAGRTATLRAPGEPFQDRDLDGTYDAGEGWINLQYPTTLTAQMFPAPNDFLQADGITNGTTAVRNPFGPVVTADVSLWGILATTGRYDASGAARHFGSIWALSGIEQSYSASPAAKVYWDDSIRRGEWPPADWPLPRVTATRWQTDL